MDKCKYKTSDYIYTFTCVICGEVWYYPTPEDPVVCNGCENELARQEAIENNKRASDKHLEVMNHILKQHYYGPLQSQLNESMPEFRQEYDVGPLEIKKTQDRKQAGIKFIGDTKVIKRNPFIKTHNKKESRKFWKR